MACKAFMKQPQNQIVRYENRQAVYCGGSFVGGKYPGNGKCRQNQYQWQNIGEKYGRPAPALGNDDHNGLTGLIAFRGRRIYLQAVKAAVEYAAAVFQTAGRTG